MYVLTGALQLKATLLLFDVNENQVLDHYLADM